MEYISLDGGDGILYYLQRSGVLAAQSDTASRTKTRGIGNADLGFIPVTIADQLATYAGFFAQYAVLAATPYMHALPQIEGILHAVLPRLNMECAAAKTVQVVDAGLERFVA